MKPRFTKIESVQKLDDLGIQIVLENYYEFPKQHSNLYATDMNGNFLWEATKPIPHDSYVHVGELTYTHVEEHGHIGMKRALHGHTWEGFECVIDVTNGHLISGEWTTK